MTVIVKVRGAIGAAKMREFHCLACDAWFDAFTKMNGAGEIEKRTHSCGALCSTAIKPGSKMAIRSQEIASPERRKVFQKYWGLTDDQMKKVRNDQIDRVYKKHGLVEVDAAWDDAVNGGRRERGDLVDLPPDTEDPNEVRDWNAKKYGREHVLAEQQKTRAAFEALQRGDTPPHLPEATSTDVHSTPHLIDVERVVKDVVTSPTVDPERRRELQGKVVMGR